MTEIDTSLMLEMYARGFSVKEVGRVVGVSAGKAFQVLRDSGCCFRKRGFPAGHKMRPESVEKSRAARCGRKVSLETKEKLSKVRKCHFDGMIGYGHTKLNTHGYVLVYVPDHPRAHKDGYYWLHVVLVERDIGRYLRENEVVHHINRIRDDNRIDNLRLMDKKEHMSMHMRERNRRNNYQ